MYFFNESLILNPVECIYNLVIGGKQKFSDCITTSRPSCGGTCTALITDFLKSVTTSSGDFRLGRCVLSIIVHLGIKEAG